MNDDGNQFFKRSNTSKSLTTEGSLALEYTEKKYVLLKAFYAVICSFNSLIGIYILVKYHSVLSNNLFFVLIYTIFQTFIVPIAIVIGGLSLIVIRIIKFNSPSQSGFTEFQDENDSQINKQIITVVFIIVLAFLYVISIPSSIISIINMKSSSLFSNSEKYSSVYTFISINLVLSVAILGVIIYVYVIKKMQSNKVKLNLDEEFIKNIEDEIQRSNLFSGIIPSNNNLIHLNEMFNKQKIFELQNNNYSLDKLNLNKKIQEKEDKNNSYMSESVKENINDENNLNRSDNQVQTTNKKEEIKNMLKRNTLKLDSEKDPNKKILKQLSLLKEEIKNNKSSISRRYTTNDDNIINPVRKALNFDDDLKNQRSESFNKVSCSSDYYSNENNKDEIKLKKEEIENDFRKFTT